MHSYSETRILPYTPEQLFALVIDIEKYPQFLPWCRAARVVNREANGTFLGELIVSFSHLTERYTSRITSVASEQIDVELVSGPFSHLANHWRFAPHPQGCEIQLALNFQFKSKLLDKLIGGMFERASAKMVTAFMVRAEALYGKID